MPAPPNRAATTAWTPLVVCPHPAMAQRILAVLRELALLPAATLGEYPRMGSVALIAQQHACDICFLDVASNPEHAQVLISELAPAVPVVPPVAFTPPAPLEPPLLAPPVPEESPPLLDEQPTIPMEAKSAPAAKIDDKCLIFIFESPRLFCASVRTSFGEKATLPVRRPSRSSPFCLGECQRCTAVVKKKFPVMACRGEKAEYQPPRAWQKCGQTNMF